MVPRFSFPHSIKPSCVLLRERHYQHRLCKLLGANRSLPCPTGTICSAIVALRNKNIVGVLGNLNRFNVFFRKNIYFTEYSLSFGNETVLPLPASSKEA